MRRYLPRGAGVGVVVGEEAPHGRGSLRSILESEGFTVLGQASNPEDLERILTSTDPDVLVLDAQAGATTVLAAREWAPRVRIVVVWPADVRAEAADQHVVPSQAATELGGAVLMAARSRRMPPAPPTIVPAVLVVPDVEAEVPVPVPVLAADGVVVLPETDPQEAAGAAALTPARRAWTSFALAAACLLVAFVAAFASQPGSRSGLLAEPPAVTPPDVGRPGNGGAGGNAGNHHNPPLQPSGVPRPPRVQDPAGQVIGLLVGTAPSAGATDGTTTRSSGGQAGDPAVRDRSLQRRHQRRHDRRHQQRHDRRHHRRQVAHNRDHGQANGHPSHDGDHGHSPHPSHPHHPDHGGSKHGNNGHHGNPHD